MAVVDDLRKIFEETFAYDTRRFSAATVPDDVKKILEILASKGIED